MSLFYNGWRTVTVVWLDGSTEEIECLGEPYIVRDSILTLKVDHEGTLRHIPIRAIREWRAKEYR